MGTVAMQRKMAEGASLFRPKLAAKICYLIAGLALLLPSTVSAQSLFDYLAGGQKVNWAGTRISSVPCAGCDHSLHFKSEKVLDLTKVPSSVTWSPDGEYLSVGTLQEGAYTIYSTQHWQVIGTIQRNDFRVSQHALDKFVDHDQALILQRTSGSSTIKFTPISDYDISIEKWDFHRNLITEKFYGMFDYERTSDPEQERRDAVATAIAISSDDRYIAASGGGGGNQAMVLIYNSEDARVVRRIDCQPRNPPGAISFSPDNKTIALAGCHIGKVSFYDVDTGRMLYETNGAGEAFDYGFDVISYSPDGTFLAVGSLSDLDYGVVTIVKATDGTILGSTPRVESTISNLQWVNGDQQVMVSYNPWYGRNWDTGVSLEGTDRSDVRIWDVRTFSLVTQFGGFQLGPAAFSPDGKSLAISVDTHINIGTVQ